MGYAQRLRAKTNPKYGNATFIGSVEKIKFRVDPMANGFAVIYRPLRSKDDGDIVASNIRNRTISKYVMDVNHGATPLQCLANETGVVFSVMSQDNNPHALPPPRWGRS